MSKLDAAVTTFIIQFHKSFTSFQPIIKELNIRTIGKIESFFLPPKH